MKIIVILLSTILLNISMVNAAVFDKLEFFGGLYAVSFEDDLHCTSGCTTNNTRKVDARDFGLSTGFYYKGLGLVNVGIEGMLSGGLWSATLFNLRKEFGSWGVEVGAGRSRDRISNRTTADLSSSYDVPKKYDPKYNKDAVYRWNRIDERTSPIYSIGLTKRFAIYEDGTEHYVSIRYMHSDQTHRGQVLGSEDFKTMPVSEILSPEIKRRRQIFMLGYRIKF